jgi:biotin operon repressor
MSATLSPCRPGREKVDPAFIAAVIFLRRSCSVNDLAAILGCGRKRVLTALARLARLGVPVYKDLNAPRYRALTPAQQEDVTTLHNNGHGLDFYALCRVVRNAHPLAIYLFVSHTVHPRAWWVRPCSQCGRPFASPQSSIRLCPSEGSLRRALGSS